MVVGSPRGTIDLFIANYEYSGDLEKNDNINADDHDDGRDDVDCNCEK